VKFATKTVTENIVIVVSIHKNNVIDKSDVVERYSVMFATTCISPRLGSSILY
jgi:hypothetical protein